MEDIAFDAMLDFQNMYRAYRRAAAGKRDKQEFIDFELDLSRNLWEIIHQMEDKTYRVGGYRESFQSVGSGGCPHSPGSQLEEQNQGGL